MWISSGDAYDQCADSGIVAQSRVDYRKLRRSARTGSIRELIADLRLRLPIQWQRVYTAAASHIPNIIHVEYGTFDYICDSYSGMEALGEVAIDQRVRDRVVGVLNLIADARSSARLTAEGLGGASGRGR